MKQYVWFNRNSQTIARECTEGPIHWRAPNRWIVWSKWIRNKCVTLVLTIYTVCGCAHSCIHRYSDYAFKRCNTKWILILRLHRVIHFQCILQPMHLFFLTHSMFRESIIRIVLCISLSVVPWGGFTYLLIISYSHSNNTMICFKTLLVLMLLITSTIHVFTIKYYYY